MKPKANNLFHFTKSLGGLKLILEKGILPRYCREDIKWINARPCDFMAFPMSCFCDIPLTRIDEHTRFYGEYGIGLTKEWGIKNKLNPVIYSPPNGQIQQLFEYLYTQVVGKNKSEMSDNTYKLLSLLKPISGSSIKSSGEIEEKEFYQENEWRYAPLGYNVLLEDQYNAHKDEWNKKIEHDGLVILPSDIRYIFLKSDSEIVELIDFIDHTFKEYHHADDVKILFSRVVSLDTLRPDL